MIKTLIIDDEKIIRMTLCKIIDWASLGFQIVGEAKNGVEAISMIEMLVPDLILLDINIPIRNGIEVCRAIAQKGLPTKVIILTGYDSFRYAQECLRLGVLDYLVKPIDKNELEKSLQNVKHKLNTKAPALSSLKSPAEKEPFLTDICSETILTGALVCIAEIDRLYHDYSTLGEQTHILQRVLNFFKDSSDLYHDMLSCSIEQDQIIWFCTCSPITAKHQIKNIQTQLWNILNISLSVGICTVGLTDNNFSYCKAIAVQSVEMKFYTGTRSCNLHDTLIKEDFTNSLSFDSAQFMNYLHNNNMNEFIGYVNNTLQEIIQKKPLKSQLFLYCIRMLNQMTDYINHSNLTINDMNTTELDILTWLKHCEFSDDLMTYMISTTKHLMKNIVKQQQYSPIINNALAYIQKHYSDPELSLSKIAKNLYVTNGYLSRTFKKETASTITEYITQYRMDIALQLLKSGDYQKITDIAQTVGYTDALYFSKLFKKQTGISPSKYL